MKSVCEILESTMYSLAECSGKWVWKDKWCPATGGLDAMQRKLLKDFKQGRLHEIRFIWNDKSAKNKLCELLP